VLFLALGLVLYITPLRSFAADAVLPGWKHTGTFTVLTTPEGANQRMRGGLRWSETDCGLR
jgi:hypothetical protein